MDPHFDGVIFYTHAAELRRRLAHPHPPHRVLDVRPRGEYDAGHIPGAVSVPAGDGVAGLSSAVPASAEAYVVAADPWDPAATAASRTLLAAGVRRVVVLTGGMEEWRGRGYDEESASRGDSTRAAA